MRFLASNRVGFPPLNSSDSVRAFTWRVQMSFMSFSKRAYAIFSTSDTPRNLPDEVVLDLFRKYEH